MVHLNRGLKEKGKNWLSGLKQRGGGVGAAFNTTEELI